jgi:hypothetical protein
MLNGTQHGIRSFIKFKYLFSKIGQVVKYVALFVLSLTALAELIIVESHLTSAQRW